MQRQVASGRLRWGFHGASVPGDAEEAASGEAQVKLVLWQLPVSGKYLAAVLSDPGEQCSG